MPFLLTQGDITKRRVDAIVNAANRELLQGGGVCNSIFTAAGAVALQEACNRLSPVATGDVAITPGFSLPAKFVIHAVGPVWQGGGQGEDDLLYSCYAKALHLAQEKDLASIAFPLISSGICGYPKQRAYAIAIKAILEFLKHHELTVYLVLFHESFVRDREGQDPKLETYLAEQQPIVSDSLDPFGGEVLYCCKVAPSKHLEEVIQNAQESFSRKLFHLIEEKKLDEVEVYKGANIDRKHFSKIRSDDSYQPKKKTVLAFAISLHLNRGETKDLLERAGFSLSQSYVFDIIIDYYITNKRYDIHEINQVLFSYEQPLLGS